MRADVDVVEGRARFTFRHCYDGQMAAIRYVRIFDSDSGRTMCHLYSPSSAKHIVGSWTYGERLEGYRLSQCEPLIAGREYELLMANGRFKRAWFTIRNQVADVEQNKCE